ncbi:MAG: ribosome maturation factor RimP [Clostridiales bacterium]|jgi:ribosome maturation factor RimP|nr:ribosome maturation factor RimP [Clostridiales bacterium]
MKLTDKVAALAEPVLSQMSFILWDVEFVKEGGEQYLRIFLDKPGGITIDDCEAFSRAMDKILDDADLIRDSYIFEVSSAGIERRLTKPFHFKTSIGNTVLLRTYSPKNGNKEFIGKLTAYNDGDVELDGTESFSKNEIAMVRLHVDF